MLMNKDITNWSFSKIGQFNLLVGYADLCNLNGMTKENSISSKTMMLKKCSSSLKEKQNLFYLNLLTNHIFPSLTTIISVWLMSSVAPSNTTSTWRTGGWTRTNWRDNSRSKIRLKVKFSSFHLKVFMICISNSQMSSVLYLTILVSDIIKLFKRKLTLNWCAQSMSEKSTTWIRLNISLII